jgi:hypothetical protein
MEPTVESLLGTPKTTPEDFVEDLDLCAEIIRALGKDAI